MVCILICIEVFALELRCIGYYDDSIRSRVCFQLWLLGLSGDGDAPLQYRRDDKESNQDRPAYKVVDDTLVHELEEEAYHKEVVQGTYVVELEVNHIHIHSHNHRTLDIHNSPYVYICNPSLTFLYV